jgi:metal-dependent amidase/aminoacylase/carboxypeptidase family protein
VNHKEETEFLVEIAKQIPEVETVEETAPHMGGEDYAYYLRHVKGTFFFTGAKPEGVEVAYPHHHPKFDINEKSLLVAAKTLGSATVQYQNQAQKSLVQPHQA